MTQQNLQLEWEILSKKEQISSESRKQQEYKACGQIQHDQSQEKILESLMNELTLLSKEEHTQLANPTFPVMQQLKASAKGHTVYSDTGIFEYDKLEISEFVFAFLEFIQQQPHTQHGSLPQYLQLLMEKAMNYSWSSVRNFNLSINHALSQGRLQWSQMDLIQAKSTTFFCHADLCSSQNTKSRFLSSRQPRLATERAKRHALY